MNSGPHRFSPAQLVEPAVIQHRYAQLSRNVGPLARVPLDKKLVLNDQIAELCDWLTRRYGDSARRVLAFHYVVGSTDPDGKFKGICDALDFPGEDRLLGPDGRIHKLLAECGATDPVIALMLPESESTQ